MTKAQQRILGFLVAAGGNETTGSTAREISDGTGLGYNSVYVALRETDGVNSIPGVLKCNWHTNTGAAQYYVNPKLLKAEMPQHLVNNTIFDSSEWANVPEYVFAALSETVDKEPASFDRIKELIKALDELDAEKAGFYDRVAIASQTIAILALQLRA